MDKIDITMTSVLRPEIVRGTLKSFFKSMFYKNPDRYRLIVNIDPLGNGKATANDVLEVCKNHFKKVVYNISKEPSFPKAVRWTWDQVESPWVFHLEDDWIVHRKVDVDHMIEIMNKYKDLACLRLYKEPIPNVLTPRIFNTKYRYNEEGFFVADDQKKQFGLNPVLIRGEFVKTGRTMMVDDKNPEKQFRFKNPKMSDFIMKWKYGIYGKPGDARLVWGKRGKYWRDANHFSKVTPGREQFISWRKLE